MQRNADAKELWGDNSLPDISAVFRSCLGYANSPAWVMIHRSIEDTFGSFNGLKSIELGCGEAKVSLLFSLQGTKTTLVDYNHEQLKSAKYIFEKFNSKPAIVEKDLFRLPKSFWGQYDVSMSFGTAEHFHGNERQAVFEAHCNVLRKGGLSIIWVPNRYGIFYRFGVTARKLLRRQVCKIDETPFTRKELSQRAKESGLSIITVRGVGALRNDFFKFVLDFPRLLRLPDNEKAFPDGEKAKEELLESMARNDNSVTPWNNLFSYPLVFIGKRT